VPATMFHLLLVSIRLSVREPLRLKGLQFRDLRLSSSAPSRLRAAFLIFGRRRADPPG
jgi:hypothetical protein